MENYSKKKKKNKNKNSAFNRKIAVKILKLL